jgi:hypothetical protein
MSPISGQAPDLNLSTDLFEIIGRLRRSANTASRYGQLDELMRIADEIVQWQIRLRKAVVDALGHHEMATGWGTIVNQIDSTRRERDSIQTLNQMTLEDIRHLEQAYGEARQELERLRREKRDD